MSAIILLSLWFYLLHPSLSSAVFYSSTSLYVTKMATCSSWLLMVLMNDDPKGTIVPRAPACPGEDVDRPGSHHMLLLAMLWRPGKGIFWLASIGHMCTQWRREGWGWFPCTTCLSRIPMAWETVASQVKGWWANEHLSMKVSQGCCLKLVKWKKKRSSNLSYAFYTFLPAPLRSRDWGMQQGRKREGFRTRQTWAQILSPSLLRGCVAFSKSSNPLKEFLHW